MDSGFTDDVLDVIWSFVVRCHIHDIFLEFNLCIIGLLPLAVLKEVRS